MYKNNDGEGWGFKIIQKVITKYLNDPKVINNILSNCCTSIICAIQS